MRRLSARTLFKQRNYTWLCTTGTRCLRPFTKSLFMELRLNGTPFFRLDCCRRRPKSQEIRITEFSGSTTHERRQEKKLPPIWSSLLFSSDPVVSRLLIRHEIHWSELPADVLPLLVIGGDTSEEATTCEEETEEDD